MKIRRHNNGIYYAHLTGTTPVNLKTSSRREAARLAKEAKLEELEFMAKAKLLTAEVVQRLMADEKVTGEKALTLWLEWAAAGKLTDATRHSYAGHIERFLVQAGLKGVPISGATEAAVNSFVNNTDDAVLATRKVRKAALDHFFNYCSAKGFVLGNPAQLVDVDVSRLSFEQKEPAVCEPFTPEELKRMRAHITDIFWYAAVVLSDNYGLRLSDVAQLEWASFRLADYIIVWTDKHDKRVKLPLAPEVRELINRLPRLDPDLVFPDQWEIARDPARRAWLSTQFIRLIKTLGIEGKSFHGLRHTFATRCAAMGDTVDEIREKMGHSSTNTTEGYIHT